MQLWADQNIFRNSNEILKVSKVSNKNAGRTSLSNPSIVSMLISPLDTGRKLTYIRCLVDILDVFWTSYVRSRYILSSGGYRMFASSI